MRDAWDDRKKALENEYFHKKEQELIEKLKRDSEQTQVEKSPDERFPKCGDD